MTNPPAPLWGHQAERHMFESDSFRQPINQSGKLASLQPCNLYKIPSLQAYGLSKLHIWDLTALKLVFYSQNVLKLLAYGVHLCNNVLIFQGKPETGPACHSVLGTGLHHDQWTWFIMMRCHADSSWWVIMMNHRDTSWWLIRMPCDYCPWCIMTRHHDTKRWLIMTHRNLATTSLRFKQGWKLSSQNSLQLT